MSEMVERVARAFCRAMAEDERGWEYMQGEARAAIAAMREPTHEMTYAGHDVPMAVGLAAPPADEVWQAMIDEALK